MGRNLFDFSNEQINSRLDECNFTKTSEEELKKNIDTDTLGEASKLYDKYKNYSTDELSNEFISLSKKRLKDGSLTKDKLLSTFSSISSFLSPSQKEFFDKLMGELDDK